MTYNLVDTFLEEAGDLIADAEQCGLALLTDESPETVNRLFRAFHTIKGSGGMCGLDELASFTHRVENLLEQVRAGSVPVSERLVEVVLKAIDHVKCLVDAVRGAGAVPVGLGESLAAEIASFMDMPPPRLEAEAKQAPQHAGDERLWTILFRPNSQWLVNGGNPAALLRDLRKLGACQVSAHTEDIPPVGELQPERCYLWWTATLRTRRMETAIRDVFVFVEDDSTIEVTAAEREVPTSPGRVAATKVTAKESTVRVPAERLDRLVNLVGELVMNHSCLAQAASQHGAAELANPVQVLERLVTELRDNVLGIRMLPIGTLFGRFRRLVHDLSLELGKDVVLVTEGAETELDKSILDQLGEPLVHCLRNCLDHGVETPEERIAKGKPRQAQLRLSAAHKGSTVVIGIEDDGRGIDRQAILAKAVEKQLVAANADLTDAEILKLIVLPGFSTARQVTSVSGRGVGMDAVKRQVDALHGSLAISSVEGEGTRISMTLPLTLAIIEGLLVRVGADDYIVPMSSVTENVELMQADRSRYNGRNMIVVRGELISYIDVRQAFGIPGEAPAIEKVVIVQYQGERVGLAVDRVLGTHQTVIQSLGRFYRSMEVVSGATILGDGRVALILDIAAVVRHADRLCFGQEADVQSPEAKRRMEARR